MKNIFFVLIVSLFISGCAFTTETVDIAYRSTSSVTQYEGANEVVVNVSMKDSRGVEGNKVSSKKNGYGMETAPILASEAPTATIKRAIEDELRKRGFKLGNDSSVNVSADLSRFWNDHKVGFFAGDAVADFDMDVNIIDKNGTSVFSKSIVTQGIEKNIQLMTGSNAKLALDKALENGINLLFDDQNFVNALVSTYKKNTQQAVILIRDENSISQPQTSSKASAQSVDGDYKKLGELKSMYDQGLINKEDYDNKRKKLLNKSLD